MTRHGSILIKNVYYMLSYAFTALRQKNFSDLQTEEFDHINDLFAAFLSKGIAQQLKQGLYRTYIDCSDDLMVIREKIDISRTIRNRAADHIQVVCDFDELSENNLLNQILKTTAMLLIRQDDVSEKYRDALKKEMLYFSNVSETDLGSVRWNAITYHRNNRTYEMLMAICRLLAEGSLMTTEKGEHRLASFVDDQRFSHLFEKFVLEYYAQEYAAKIPAFSSRASQIPWQLDSDVDQYLPIMQSDISLTCRDKVLIIDTKFYSRIYAEHFDMQTFRSANLYQIFTYVKNKEASLTGVPHKVAGMLLYAKTDQESVPDVDYEMSGNKISIRMLDLNQEFPMICARLDGIVSDYFGHAKRSDK